MLAASVEATGSVATADLTAGQVGLVDASTYLTVAAGTVPAEFLIVQGNYNTTDTLGGNPLHGGYSESIKSKMIKPAFIRKIWSTTDSCEAITCPTVTVTIPSDCFSCDEHPQIRLDVKGSSILRALNRNGYTVLDAGGCCTGTNFTGDEIGTAWVEQITADATLNEFVTAVLTPEVVTVGSEADAYVTFTLCHEDDSFDDCSFDTRDHYNTEPLTLAISAIDDEGDACTDTCLVIGADVITATGVVTGESILRDLILDGRYRQDGGHNQGNRDSARRREIEGGDALIAAVTRGARYNVYYLQHSVPRFNNPTGVFDNDQYVIAIAVECGGSGIAAAETALGTLMGDIATAAGITVESK